MQPNTWRYLVFAGSVLMFLLLSYLGSVSFALKGSVGAVVNFGVVYWLNRFTDRRLLMRIYAAPQLLPLLILHAMDFPETLLALPSSVSIAAGLLLGRVATTSRRRALTSLLGLTILITGLYKGTAYWMNYRFIGSFSGKAEMKSRPVFEARGEDGEVKIIPRPGRWAVMEFWFSTCGACYERQPEFEALRLECADLPVDFYAVLRPMKHDGRMQRAIRRVQDQFGFEVMIPLDSLLLDSILGVTAYPSLALVDPNGIVRYYGLPEGGVEALREELH